MADDVVDVQVCSNPACGNYDSYVSEGSIGTACSQCGHFTKTRKGKKVEGCSKFVVVIFGLGISLYLAFQWLAAS